MFDPIAPLFPLKRTMLLGICAVFAFASPAVSAHRFEWYNGRWAHETSQMKPDPALCYGRLENGVRWVLYPTDEKPGHPSIRLNVQAGTLMETPEQAGAAHVVKIAAFEKALNPVLNNVKFTTKNRGITQKEEARRSVKDNATVYRLDLTGDSHEEIQSALKVLRKVADGLTLSDAEMENYRPQVMADIETLRAGVFAKRGFMDSIGTTPEQERNWRRFLYEGTRLADVVSVDRARLKKLSARDVRDFYRTWYLPSRMVVVMVGNINPTLAEAFMKRYFGSIPAAPLVYPEETGALDTHGIKAYTHHSPSSHTVVSVHIVSPLWPPMATMKRHRFRTIERILLTALQRRLNRLAERYPGDWTEATIEGERFDPPQPVLTFRAVTAGDDWKRTLRAVEKQFNTIRSYGLTRSEFEEVTKELEILLIRRLEDEKTVKTEEAADALVRDINLGKIPLSAAQQLEAYRRILKTLTLEETNRALFATLAVPNRRIRIEGAAQARPDEVVALWKSLEGELAEPPHEHSRLAFPYLEEPAVAFPLPLEKKQLPGEQFELYIWEGELENGIKVILQPLPFERRKVRVDFYYGDGLYGVPDAQAPVPRLAVESLLQNGIGRLSRVETDRLFKAHGLDVSESIACFNNRIEGHARTEDMETLLQAVWTQFTDPFLSDKNVRATLKRLLATETQRTGSVEKIARQARLHYFTGSALRTKPIYHADYEKIGLASLNDYLVDVHKHGPRVLQISGDFEVSKAADIIARLFTPIEAADHEGRLLGKGLSFPTEARRILHVKNDTSGEGVVQLAMQADLKATHDRRRLMARTIASLVIRSRLQEEITKALPAGAHPMVLYRHEPEHGGFGYLLLETRTRETALMGAEALMRRVLGDLKQGGVTDAEVERFRGPLKANWRKKRTKNDTWSRLVMNTTIYEKPYIHWYDETGRHIDTLTAKEINKEVAVMLKGREALLLIKK